MPKDIKYSSDLQTAIDFSNIIIIAIAAQAMKDLSSNIRKCEPKNKVFILCMKGIDCETGERLSEILRKNIGVTNKICVWAGPGHVQELTVGKPNVMVAASDDKVTAVEIIKMFETDLIQIFESDDLIGIEVGAAAKNVMGIAAGFLDGLGFSSLKGALMARGCYEVSRLIQKMGGNRMTAFGMSHLGDFEATLFSRNSHNRMYGEKFITKQGFESVGTAEGFGNTKAIYNIAQKIEVAMPITNAVYSVLFKNGDPKAELKKLFTNMSVREFEYE
jgi:glycerol-3-phosphate dehydrogenase (NAD(P)+)